SMPILIQKAACALIDRHDTALALRSWSCRSSSMFTITICFGLYETYMNHIVRLAMAQVSRCCDQRREHGCLGVSAQETSPVALSCYASTPCGVSPLSGFHRSLASLG